MAVHGILLCDEYTQERSWRLSVRQLRARRRALAARLGDVQQVLAGSLTEQSRRCGRAAAGARTGSRTARMPTSPRARLAAAGHGTCRLRWPQWCAVTCSAAPRCEAVLAEISAINAELLARRELR